MKKILSLVFAGLTILSILSALSASAFADDSQCITRAEAVEKIVQYMYDLSSGEPFDLDMTYCMHEMRSMHFTLPLTEQGEVTYPLLASIYHSMGWNGFSDVTDEHKSAIELNIAKEMGIVNGMGNGMFCPDEAITFGQAVKMLVCAVGHNEWAKLNGGYPSGYLKVADEIGAAKNIKLEANSLISVQEFETLLKDFFELDDYPMKSVLTTMPVTAESCAKIYAEGVKTRNARIQLAVFGDELKRQNRSDFEERNWTTGVSSPWCAKYEIEKISDTNYNVTFYYATSTGDEGNMVVNLTLEQFGPVYKITKIEASRYNY